MRKGLLKASLQNAAVEHESRLVQDVDLKAEGFQFEPRVDGRAVPPRNYKVFATPASDFVVKRFVTVLGSADVGLSPSVSVQHQPHNTALARARTILLSANMAAMFNCSSAFRSENSPSEYGRKGMPEAANSCARACTRSWVRPARKLLKCSWACSPFL